jgi:hypothetical protein
MKDTRLHKTRDQMVSELKQELTNLRLACDQWEMGYFEKTTEIARCLRVLVYDYGGKKESIFSHLGWKSKPFFVTSSLVKLGSTSLRQLIMTDVIIEPNVGNAPSIQTFRHAPRYFYGEQAHSYDFDAKTKWRGVSFMEWWSECIYINDQFRLTRGDVVLAVCNELGGTHSASKIRPETDSLDVPPNQGVFGVFTINGNEGEQRATNRVHDALIRQIAYELHRTIDRHFAEFSPKPVIAMPFPRNWRDNFGVRLESEPSHLRAVLNEHLKDGPSDVVIVSEILSELYWVDRREESRSRGL